MYIAGMAVPLTGRVFVSFALCALLPAGPTCISCKYGKKREHQRWLTADPTEAHHMHIGPPAVQASDHARAFLVGPLMAAGGVVD